MAVAIPAYRRPDLLFKVLSELRRECVSHIYIGIDGPKPGLEEEVQQTRGVAQAFAQGSDIPTSIRSRQRNVGTAVNVLSTIDWMFEVEPRGAILEEDCVPSGDFFLFLDAALAQYAQDSHVWMASGSQLAPSSLIEGTHVLSPYGLIWGWGTTRHKWKEMFERLTLSLSAGGKLVKDPRVRIGWHEREFWKAGHRRASQGFLDSWAMPITATAIFSGSVGALPPHNLVLNVGNDNRATHTAGDEKWTGISTRSGLRLPLGLSLAEDNARVTHWLSRNLFEIGSRHQITTRITALKDRTGLNSRKQPLAVRLQGANAGEVSG